MSVSEESLKLHYDLKGKLEIKCRARVNSKEALALAYTPGVAAPCLEIQKDINKSFELTRRWNTVAVVTDGTAILGLGDIGPEAGMPVMEGKCVLFKSFGDVDAIPLCIRSKDVDEIVRTVSLLSGSFGGINLEDIAAPRCFEIEEKLKQCCDIPIFHDDQHGTAIVVTSAVLNALKLVKKDIGKIKVAVSGAGSAGLAVSQMLVNAGVKNIFVCNSRGILSTKNERINPAQLEFAKRTNPHDVSGTLADAIGDADIFVGVSAPGIVSKEMVKSMADKPIVLAMANPVPEIMPDEAKEAGAYIVGTGRSDFPNQINNVLVFPGIFRGALDVRASEINEEMKLAAAYAIADIVGDDLEPDYIIPAAFDERVGKAVSEAVKKAAIKSGVARI